jgi:hypothetical protein
VIRVFLWGITATEKWEWQKIFAVCLGFGFRVFWCRVIQVQGYSDNYIAMSVSKTHLLK